MRLARSLALSTALVAPVFGCGESTQTPASTSIGAAAPDASKGAAAKGKQTFENRRAYSAADPEGPPSKY